MSALRPAGVDYARYRFLVIDDQPLVRQSLRSCVQAMGGFVVDFAQGYHDAMHRIRNLPPNIVLCDYLLGSGRSGQQLLEEVRRRELLPEEAIFIMVTGEQSYEGVVACVELAPDDYILKPFSPELLSVRVHRLIVKKQLLQPYYEAKREARHDDAKRFLDLALEMRQFAAYKIDLMRCDAELMLATNRLDDARKAYQRILDIHPIPWANVGIARVLQRGGSLEEARARVEEVIAGAPNFLAAYDLKASICADMGDHQEAQSTLTNVVARSPRNQRRKRALAAAALANGDAQTANSVMQEVIASEAATGAAGIEDYLMLARGALDANDILAAERAIECAKGIQVMDLDHRLACAALRAVIAPAAGTPDFLVLREVWLGTPMLPERLVDGLRAALAIGDNAFADEIARRLMDEEGVRRVFQSALSIYARHGRQQDFRDLQKQAALARIRHAPPG